MNTLLDKFESHGGFWLPSNDKQVVLGELIFDPDEESIRLLLTEDFKDGTQRPDIIDPPDLPVIFGVLTSGQRVTLINGIVSFRRIGMGPGGPITITPHHIMLGGHIAVPYEMRVLSFEASYTLLNTWAEHTNIAREEQRADNRIDLIDYHCHLPKDEVFDIAAISTQVILSQRIEFSHKQDAITIEPVSFFKVVPKAPITIAVANQIKWNLQNLLTLLTDAIVAARFFELEFDLPNTVARQQSPTTKVMFMGIQTTKKPEPSERHTFPVEMLAPMSLIRPHFSHIINRWFEIAERSKVALDVCFGSLYQPASVLNLRFLSVIQAIESYHRSLGVGLYMNQTKFDELMEQFKTHLPEGIEGDHRVSLKNRLKFANEFSLRKRLNLIIAELPEDAKAAITVNPADFVTHVVDTRNQFTHYNSKQEGKVLDGPSILWASERLRMLLTSMMLLDIGIAKESLLPILRRNRMFQEVMFQPMAFTA